MGLECDNFHKQFKWLREKKNLFQNLPSCFSIKQFFLSVVPKRNRIVHSGSLLLFYNRSIVKKKIKTQHKGNDRILLSIIDGTYA